MRTLQFHVSILGFYVLCLYVLQKQNYESTFTEIKNFKYFSTCLAFYKAGIFHLKRSIKNVGIFLDLQYIIRQVSRFINFVTLSDVDTHFTY